MNPLLPAAARLVPPLTERLVGGVQDTVRFMDELLSKLSPPSPDDLRPAEDDSPAAGAFATNLLPRVDHLAQLVDRELQAFVDRFNQRAQAVGVDAGIPFNLKQSVAGDLVVDSYHPQRAEIEQLLREDPSLSTSFRRSLAATDALRRMLQEGLPDRLDIVLHVEAGAAHFTPV